MPSPPGHHSQPFIMGGMPAAGEALAVFTHNSGPIGRKCTPTARYSPTGLSNKISSPGARLKLYAAKFYADGSA